MLPHDERLERDPHRDTAYSMKRSLILTGLAAMLAFVFSNSAACAEEVRKAEAPPRAGVLDNGSEGPVTAEEIMRLVRLSYALQDNKLPGKLRDNGGNTARFILTMEQKMISFLFPDQKQIVRLDLSTSPPTLREVKPGGAAEVALERYSDKVLGFDLNYEDLSLRFLYWEQAELLGEEGLGIGAGKAWKVRVKTPDARGPYGYVDIWVHQDSGGMAKMEGWDKKTGNLIKRYQVKSLQKVDKVYAPKEMRIESFDPNTKDSTGMTYMTFDKPVKK